MDPNSDFAVFSKVASESMLYEYLKVELLGCSVTSYCINIDTYEKFNCEHCELRSFVEARNYFHQMCVYLQRIEGCYRLQIEFENAEHLQNAHNQPESQLKESVVNFLKRIIDRHLPLGIPKDQEIENASKKLSGIIPAIDQGKKCEIVHLSNMYYQMVAYPCGGGSRQQINQNPKYDNRKNCRPPLDSNDLVGKAEHLQRLWSLRDAMEQGIQAENVNPLDYIYHNYLNINLWPIVSGTKEYRRFIWYYRLEHISDRIRSVFKVENSEWAESFRNDIGNQRFLFHSTHSANAINILRDGLQIAPEHVFSYNRWAGKGIYFHDRIDATSAYAQRLNHNIVFICCVALGNEEILRKCPFNQNPDHMYPLPHNKNSIKQLGTGCCSQFEQYDEFIIQNARQVKIEFILELS